MTFVAFETKDGRYFNVTGAYPISTSVRYRL
jgi:hypothetical protein